MKRTIIIGGGTFNPVRNHFSLAAPAFGSTAKYIHSKIPGSELILTKMANPESSILTNQHLSDYVDTLIADPNVGTIVMNAAVCDFEAEIDGIPSDNHAERLKTAAGRHIIELTVADKIIPKIRQKRPDIFLVGFKTTTSHTADQQYSVALKSMKSSKCNLMFANDTVTRNNMVIVPEEAKYCSIKNRYRALDILVEILKLRHRLTYSKTEHYEALDFPVDKVTSKTFQEVLRFLVDSKAFISDNGNGFTPGHFCYREGKAMYSSQRKADHNKIFEKGLTLVRKIGGEIHAYGKAKPSVGATSQQLLFEKYPEYDCIVHTHNPLKINSRIRKISQKPFQCGSIECGINTALGMEQYGPVKAVYLEKHGANILFKSSTPSSEIIKFISDNIQLNTKIN